MLNKTALTSLILLAALAPATAQTGASGAAVAGEKRDSGLGELPPYEQWSRHPQLRHLVVSSPARIAGRGNGRGQLAQAVR